MTDSIYTLIPKIAAEAGALAPQKNGGLNFAFRGVAQVTDHLAPLLQKYGVVIIPSIKTIEREHRDVGTKTVTWTKLTADYRFIAPDQSSVTATTAGMAMDFADRADAQAQSVAFRVALLQVFTLPNNEKEPEINGEEVMKGIAAERAKEGAAAAPARPAKPTVASLTRTIGELINGTYADAHGTLHEPVDKEKIHQLGEQISGKEGTAWRTNVTILQKVIEEAAK